MIGLTLTIRVDSNYRVDSNFVLLIMTNKVDLDLWLTLTKSS